MQPLKLSKPLGRISAVLMTDTPPNFTGQGLKGRAKAGVVYEKKFHREMAARHGTNYHSNLWFHYQLNGDWRWCQPDGVLIDHSTEPSTITIFECKLKHTAQSYWQLKNLYLPVLKAAFSTLFTFKLIEVCRDYDPATPYPALAPVLRKIDEPHPAELVGVFIWKL
jgi:hypothetical protein